MNIRKKYKIPVVKKGEYPHFGKGVVQVIDEKALDAIVKNTNASLGKTQKILADFDHYSELSESAKATLEKMGIQLPTNAAGWITELFREGDTVYGNMVSTVDGEKAIEGETYCKTSPVFRVIDCEYVAERKGEKLIRPLKIKSVALTNKPNMATLGNILQNTESLANSDNDLQAVIMGNQCLELESFKENTIMENTEKKEGLESVSESIETTKVEVVAEVAQAVAEAVADTGATVEAVEAVQAVAETAAVEAVEAVAEAVAETVAETAQAPVSGVAPEAVEATAAEAAPEIAPNAAELDAANAKIAELQAKIAELEALLEQEGKKRQEAELENRIGAELQKYPTLQNREEATELLKKDWDLGVKFLASLKASLAPKTILNRVPDKSPEEVLAGMSSSQRIKYKMFGKL
mgnify:CR=1 FL=1